MNEMMDHDEVEMDALLRRSMAGPVPTLAPDFGKRLLRAAGRDSEVLGRYRRMLFAGYGAVSVITSVVAMHGVGLSWLPIVEILTPLALVAAAYTARRSRHTAESTA